MPGTLFLQAFLNLVLAAAALTLWPRSRRMPWLTLTVAAGLAMGLALQLAVPGVLAAGERDAARVLAGQGWRLVTALFLQDGGLAGGLSNIVLLLLIGAAAEQVLSRPGWAAVYLAGGLAAELVALCWQPVGAGNSVATAALAGCLLLALPGPLRPRGAGALRLAAGLTLAALMWQRDIHGAGGLAGLLAGAALRGRRLQG